MRYYEKIDGLRFVAIFLVLVEHFAGEIARKISAGYYGVDLFFVISGFLITSILINTKEQSFAMAYKKFIGRRTLRIFPIYYLTIVVLFIINLEIVRDKIFWLLTYTYNYAWVLFEIPETPINHFWSLCVEEQFYLFWPFVVLLLRKSPKILMAFILAIIIIGYLQSLLNIFPELTKFNNVNVLTRMSSLGIGSLGATYSINYNLSDRFFNNYKIEFAVFIILVYTLTHQYIVSHVILAIISLYLVLKASRYKFCISIVEKFLTNSKLVYLGSISYGIYIFHLPIGYYLNKYILDSNCSNMELCNMNLFKILNSYCWVIKFPIISLASILVASLSFKYIERPILKLKDRYFYTEKSLDNE